MSTPPLYLKYASVERSCKFPPANPAECESLELSILDQSVGHFSECVLDRLLVLNQCQLLLGFREFHIRLESTTSKERLSNLGKEGPGATWTSKQTRKLIALKPKHPGQTNAREVSLLCRRHQGLLGAQILFSSTDVRPPLE